MTTAPVLDTDALRRLGDELGDKDILCGFLRRYVTMLDQRIDRLEHALAAQDHAAWMDAVLSLKTSSSLAGARALAEQAADLQAHAGDPSPAAETRWSAAGCLAEGMAILRALAAETTRQVRLFLRRAAVTVAGPT